MKCGPGDLALTDLLILHTHSWCGYSFVKWKITGSLRSRVLTEPSGTSAVSHSPWATVNGRPHSFCACLHVCAIQGTYILFEMKSSLEAQWGVYWQSFLGLRMVYCVCVSMGLCFHVASHILYNNININVNSKVKLSLGLIKRDALTTYRRVEVWLHEFLTLALDGGKWSASGLGHFIPGERAPPVWLARRLGRP
jgi:hypothetical protein